MLSCANGSKCCCAHDASGGFLDKPPVPPVSTVDEPRLSEGSGSRIGPYKLLQQIGEGGMGVVFLAEQLEPVQRKVALKVIKPGMDTHQVVARFEAERQALAMMDHPNIAKVLDAGATDSGRPYFMMELVKGLAITKYCDQEHLTPQERLQLFVPICQAVQHAHQKGIIHRDLKPSNILIALYDGRPVPKVIDFGVAKATGTKLTERTLFTEVGHAIGTWEYMAPEQAELNNLDIDTRADIYALGATLYELLTGSPPFTRKQLRNASFNEMLRLIREVEPPKPSTRLSSSEELPSLAAKRKLEPAKLSRMVRGDLDWIVMKCLEKERGRRYETANGLALDVLRYLADETVLASPPSASYRLRKFARRHKARLLTAAIVGLVLLVAAGSIGRALWDRAQQQIVNQTERNFQAKQNRALAESSLARLDDLYKQYLWTEAVALLEGAEKLVGEDGDADLRERIAQAKRKTILFRDLDNARMHITTSVDGKFNYARSTAAEYRQAFAAFGLDVQPGQTEALARRIRTEEPAVRDALLVGLDNWENCERTAFAADLRALAGAADTDPWRQEYRRAVANKDGAALARLSGEARRLSLPPTNFFLLALALDSTHQRAEAVALLRWARGRHPADFWIALEMGNLLYDSGAEPADLEERIGCFRVAVALRPAAATAHNNLGIALKDKGQLDDAIAEYQRAIDLDQNYAPALCNLGYALKDKGQLDDAIATCKRAIDLDPNDPTAHNTLGAALRDKHQVDAAIAEFKRAIELDPQYALAHNNLGNALKDEGRVDAAIAEYKLAIDLDRNLALPHYNLGLVLRDKHQVDDAIVEFKRAINVDHKLALPHYNFGLALFGKHQVSDAIVEFKRAIDLDPKLINGRNALGLALTAKGQWDDAIAEFHIVIELAPKDAPTHFNLGVALAHKKQLDDAIAEYRKAIDLDPKYAEAYCNMGHALRDQGQLDKALEALKKGNAFGTQRGPSWRNPSAKRVEDLEQLVKWQAKLAEVLADRAEPADMRERVGLIAVCQLQQRNAAAAKLYAAGFAADANWADDLEK